MKVILIAFLATLALAKATSGPYLNKVGNDGKPSSVFPLEECEGDCDNNGDCAGNLVCFLRKDGDPRPIPGCRGNPYKGVDYCFDPSNAPDPTPPDPPEPDPPEPECNIAVLLTDNDKKANGESADGKYCFKVKNDGEFKVYKRDGRRLRGGGGCNGKKLFDSDCDCDDRRRLTGGGGCADNYKLWVQGDGQLKVVDGKNNRWWKSGKSCGGRGRELAGGGSCGDDENYALVVNECDNDRVQVWEWDLKNNGKVRFLKKIWDEKMNSDLCYF